MAADGKRLSTAGKVATPKLGDQSILNDSHLYKIIGKRFVFLRLSPLRPV